jgi:hypothetical protein
MRRSLAAQFQRYEQRKDCLLIPLVCRTLNVVAKLLDEKLSETFGRIFDQY